MNEYVILRRSLPQYQLHITDASLQCERCNLSTDSIKIFFNLLVALFQVCSAKQMIPANLCAITQRVMTVRCGKTSWFHLQRTIINASLLHLSPIGCRETSVRNCQYTLRNCPEERSPHLVICFNYSLLCLRKMLRIVVSMARFVVHAGIVVWGRDEGYYPDIL
jgi:hypothetical protein